MTYPPQGGWQDPQGGWPPSQPGGWQDPAGGYVDPASGQPAYVDPISGQPAPGYPAQSSPAQPYPQYPTAPGYDYQQQAYPGYGAPMMAPAGRTNGMAIAAMVISLVGLISFWCYALPGIIFGAVGAIMGHVAKRQAAERQEQGGGMALAGIIIGWIAVVLGLIAAAFFAYIIWLAAKLPSTHPTPIYT
jgi:hypothetical protein